MSTKKLSDLIERVREGSREIVRELGLLSDVHGNLGVSNSEVHVLVALENAGTLEPLQIADLLVLEKSTVTRLLGGMVKKGLITLSAHEYDGRRKQAALGTAGRKILMKVHEQAVGRVGPALERLNAAEREMVVAGLELYSRALKEEREIAAGKSR